MLNSNAILFKNRTFNFCFDCGWGEKGVHDVNLSYAEAYTLLTLNSSEETAQRWTKNEDTYFDFKVHSYMVADCDFVESDWEGSLDY